MNSKILESLLGYQLRRTSAAMYTDFRDRIEELDLSTTQALTLLLLTESDTLNQSEAGNLLGIKRANMVPLITKLEERGLVNRVPLDGRSFRLEITDNGKDIVDLINDKIQQTENGFREKLSPEAWDSLLQTLPKLWSCPSSKV